MKEVIIAGGTGLIGRELTRMLLVKGYRVNILSRSTRKSNSNDLQYYKWDISKKEMPLDLFSKATYLINLSGANVGARRWNEAYKKEITDSRLKSTRLLVDILNREDHHITAFLNASAIGYYGINMLSPSKEDDEPGEDFMARVCVMWEEEAKKTDSLKSRLIISRTGIVFSSLEGALYQMMQPVKLFAGAPLGTGKQEVSWIHIEDVCRAMIFALENEGIKGPVNIVSPFPASNKEITETIAEVLKKPLLLPAVPVFALKLILGEFADSVLGSQSISCQKLLNAGFAFNHSQLKEAIRDLIKNRK